MTKPKLAVGIDLVRVSRIAESIEHFGDRFLQRLFTAGELAYAQAAPPLMNERLAVRFAAKEAALKALGLVDRGVSWRDIEVVTALPSHACSLRLHGRARTLADTANDDLALSLSHEGDFATAVVITTTCPILSLNRELP
jgi:holo-[acyl-carrier protein] synthase